MKICFTETGRNSTKKDIYSYAGPLTGMTYDFIIEEEYPAGSGSTDPKSLEPQITPTKNKPWYHQHKRSKY